MKYVMLALASAILAPAAGAATAIQCQSSPVNFTFTAPASIAKGSALFTVLAEGNDENSFQAKTDVVESAAAPLVVLNFTTLNGEGKDDPASSIHARLEIAVVKADDGSLQLAGTAKLQVTKIPPQHPLRMLSVYSLSGCTGTL